MSDDGSGRGLLSRARAARAVADTESHKTHLSWQLREQREHAIPYVRRILGVDLTPEDFTPERSHGWEGVPQLFEVEGMRFRYSSDYRDGRDRSKLELLNRRGRPVRVIDHIRDLA